MHEKFGKILKSVGGFFYVKSTDGVIYECKARGVFRKNEIKPVAGDFVKIYVFENETNVIQELKPRKNFLARPPIANLDQVFIVSSIKEPKINTFIIDELTVILSFLKIIPIIVISKADLANVDSISQIYRDSGFTSFGVSNKSFDNIDLIRSLIKNKTSAFVGNSGVGKSSLLNRLFPELKLETGEISKKLGRGRHTTRQVELFELCGGYVADTPGFSSLDILKCLDVEKEKLVLGFPEFQKFLGKCKFTSCSHTCEKGCKIIEAVQSKKINEKRYESYIAMYKNLKENKH